MRITRFSSKGYNIYDTQFHYYYYLSAHTYVLTTDIQNEKNNIFDFKLPKLAGLYQMIDPGNVEVETSVALP